MKLKLLLFLFLLIPFTCLPYPTIIEELYNEQTQKRLFLISDWHEALDEVLPVEQRFINIIKTLNETSPEKIDLYWEMDVPGIRFRNIFFPGQIKKIRHNVDRINKFFLFQGFLDIQKALFPKKQVAMHAIDKRFSSLRAVKELAWKKLAITFGQLKTEFEQHQKEIEDLLLKAQHLMVDTKNNWQQQFDAYIAGMTNFLKAKSSSDVITGNESFGSDYFRIMDYYFLGLFLNNEAKVSILYAGGAHCAFSSFFLRTMCNFKRVRIRVGTKNMTFFLQPLYSMKIEDLLAIEGMRNSKMQSEYGLPFTFKALDPKDLDILLSPGTFKGWLSEVSRHAFILSKIDSLLSSIKNLPSYMKRKLIETKKYIIRKIFGQQKEDVLKDASDVIKKINILNVPLATKMQKWLDVYKGEVEEAKGAGLKDISTLKLAINKMIEETVSAYCSSLTGKKDLIILKRLKVILEKVKENECAQSLVPVIQKIIKSKKT